MSIRRTFDEQLNELQSDILRLGRFVEEALGRALDALNRQDLQLAQKVIEDDDFADDITFGIQGRAMQLLALQQPMARDLRTIGASVRIVVDLERIGDYAVDISKMVRSLAGHSSLRPLVDVPSMAALAQKMVANAIQTLITRDRDLMIQVAADDDAVDEFCDRLQDELMDKMRDDPSLVEQATRLLIVARTLERAADHATNIVEHVYYMETGEMKPLAREQHQRSAITAATMEKDGTEERPAYASGAPGRNGG